MLEHAAGRAQQQYDVLKQRHLNLNLAIGKPTSEMLDLASGMFDIVNSSNVVLPNGMDCRNYGCPDGLADARKLFAGYFEASSHEVIIGGNSSVNLMYDAVVRAMLHGVPDGAEPWCRTKKVKFLCPVPGYFRHFNICRSLGIEMIPIPMGEEGPRLDLVEETAGSDPAVKGIWCVPRYSNPSGVTYSDSVVDGLASMKTASPDFRIFWDNAYMEHHLVADPKPLKNLLTACRSAGHPNRVLMFGSTSKISFAGAGISALAASNSNLDETRKQLANQTIGYDKLNQLRHVLFFGDIEGIRQHMRKHREILAPKFAAVHRVLSRELTDLNLATWTQPKGGYFISMNTRPGLAARALTLASEAGVFLPPPGASFPNQHDPDDSHIRIAPSYPTLPDIEQATEVLSLSIKLAAHGL